ncbi:MULTISPECIES: nucleoside-diphosphate sugar epimerase/dehydratase [unclassified Cyanobium]|uniref:polysaccharide biosynthesis protein n=1 Tax=unclassified Cyanobium TaxID=2627006 RepID=UPI0020CF7424|nr:MULTISPECIES: nucleoside-diphosphate sugar epimerase/dehydratase [unclassified Cyanobium]
MIITAYLGAFILRLPDAESLRGFLPSTILLLPLAVITGLPVLVVSGWYRGLTRYAGSHSLYGLVPRSGSMVLILLLISTLMGGPQPPRSFWILYWLLFTGGAIASRIVLRDVLVHHLDQRENHNPGNAKGDATLIYGAGASGMGLLLALRNDPSFRVVGFLDDDEGIQGRTLQNMPIHTPLRLPRLIERHGVSKVLLAMPAMSRRRKRQLVDQLTHRGLEVLSIPSLAQMASGQRIVSDLQAVAIEDLLGREPSNPDPVLLKAGVEGKVVMVTGAGGSIGSELCRQIVALGASRLLLVERNEFALYAMERELKSQPCGVELLAVLGDACDAGRLTLLCRRYGVDTIFHAAAYKHVPLVEANLCAGIANNIGATAAVIAATRSSGVSRLTLISTDKAVRPTNVMGASKRICELLIQAAAAEFETGGPILSMVRFGNVLGSSGSVIPLFHQQISRGGPVTVTHPAITRYFMTIPEAVQLVLQSTGMAIGGDLFLLDMGEPVRIADLARQMIELSGLRVRDDHNSDGDIAIQYTGLRPGEKLYEELLINADDQPTKHPLIRRATEPRCESEQLFPLIQQLNKALANWDEAKTAELLRRLVPEYDPYEAAATPPLVDALAR